MSEIKLTRGKVAIVDDEDFEWLSKWNWYAKKTDNVWYAWRGQWDFDKKTTKSISMHRQIMKFPDKQVEVDHINRNGLDNRKNNLRVVSHSINMINRKMQKNNTSGTRGVFFHKQINRWIAQLKLNKKIIYLGCFSDINLAIKARKEAEQKYFKV